MAPNLEESSEEINLLMPSDTKMGMKSGNTLEAELIKK